MKDYMTIHKNDLTLSIDEVRKPDKTNRQCNRLFVTCCIHFGSFYLVHTHLGGGRLSQASYTFPLHLHAKRGWVGPDSM